MRVVDAKEAKERLCGVELCERGACLVMRIETDGGPQFLCFCMAHLRVGHGILAALIEAVEIEGGSPPDST